MGKCVARIAIPRRFATQDDEGGYSPRNDTATELRTTMHIMKSFVVSASLALSVVTCSDTVQPAAAGGDKMTRTLLTDAPFPYRSEEHTSELQSRVDISYAVFCLKKK